MEVQISLCPEQKEPRAVIYTESVTEEVRTATELLRTAEHSRINGYSPGGMVERIRAQDIFRIYTERQHVYCDTPGGTFQLHKRIYELEELFGSIFVRISNSELVNLQKILRLDASLSGTIAVYLENGVKTFASRRYVRKIKEKLGL